MRNTILIILLIAAVLFAQTVPGFKLVSTAGVMALSGTPSAGWVPIATSAVAATWGPSASPSTLDLFSESRSTAGGVFSNEGHSPTYVAGSPTSNWTKNTDFTIANLSGAGYIAHVWIAMGNFTNSGLDGATITCTWDGEVTPSINGVNLGLFFHKLTPSTFSPNTAYTRYMQWSNNGVFQTYIPMPYSTSASCTLHQSDSQDWQIWTQVDYVSGPADTWPYMQRLKVSTGYGLTMGTAFQTFTLLNVTPNKKCRLAGLYMVPDGGSGGGSITPVMAFLEGFVKIYIDGAGSPSYTSTGTEDYFGFNGYYSTAGTPPKLLDYNGFYLKGTNNVATYRWHVLDPIVGNTGLKMTWDAGESTRVSWTGSGFLSYIVYYYEEI